MRLDFMEIVQIHIHVNLEHVAWSDTTFCESC